MAQTVYVLPTDINGVPDVNYCPWYGNALAYMPSGYQALNYLEGNGTQYINTGVAATNDFEHIVSLYPLNNSAQYQMFFGVFGEMSLQHWAGYSAYVVHCSSGMLQFNDADVPSGNYPKTFKVKYNSSTLSLTIDSVTRSNAFSNTPTGNTQWLFKANGSDGVSNARIYQSKMYNGGTLVRNFIPCRRSSDSVLGMFDVVEQSFYTNSGTGTFSYG